MREIRCRRHLQEGNRTVRDGDSADVTEDSGCERSQRGRGQQ